MYAVVMGIDGLSWGTDRSEALYTLFVPYVKDMQEYCKMYEEIAPISIHKNEWEARDAAMKGLMNQNIDTVYKAKLWAWQLGGFNGDPPTAT